MNPIRSILLRASESRMLAERVPSLPFVRQSVRRFMPGERLEDALTAAGALAEQGVPAVLTLLGEAVTDEGEAAEVERHYREVIDAISARGLPVELSLKLTHLGQDLDPAATRERVVRLARAADAAGAYLWLDMEQSRYVDSTLETYRAARGAAARVGVCLQANLRRTPADVEALLPLVPSIRLVKGAYREPPAQALQRRSHVDDAYLHLASRLLEAAREERLARLGVATHDPELTEKVAARAEGLGVPKERWEVQMLYGIRSEGVRELKAADRPVRVLISYGEAWFPWYVRRLAERPANLLLLARSMVRR